MQAHVKIYTGDDPSLALLEPDGSALPDLVEIVDIPAFGLRQTDVRVRVFSNDTDQALMVGLSHMAVLRPMSAPAGALEIPLRVSLNGRELTTSPVEFAAADLFDGAIPGASVTMSLLVEQAMQEANPEDGRYEGIVAITMKSAS